MSNYAPTKPHLGPHFVQPIFQNITKLQSITYLKKAIQYLLEKIWGILGNYGKVPQCFLNFPKIKLPKIPQNSP